MYQVYAGSTLLYDSSNKDTYPVTDISLKLAMNDAGSLDLTLIPGHPAYDTARQLIHKPLKVLRDNAEIFFGRVLTYEEDFQGGLHLYGEGALTFLLDSEMPKGKYTETVSAFFSRCITAHNSQVEAAKQFTVRNVRSDVASSSNTFEITSWTQTKSVLESQLLSQYGGYFEVSSDGSGGHYIDYVAAGSLINSQLIKIGENVLKKSDKGSGENIFTALRPIGSKDTVNLNNTSQSAVQISNCTLNDGVLYLNDLITKYGKIIHTETFSGIDDNTKLLREAESYIIKRRSKLPAVCDLSYVEFHYLNPSLPYVCIGNRFTNIEGFSGDAMTVTDLTIDLEDPSNDEMTLKNDEEIENDNPSSRGKSASSISSKSRSGGGGGISGAAATTYNYITQTEEHIQMHTKDIEITADNLLQLSSKVTHITATDNMYMMVFDDEQHPGYYQLGVTRKLSDGTFSPGAQALFTYENLSIKVGDVTGKRKLGMTEVDEITGSQFWASRDQLVAINGKMYVGTDGKMHVVSGSGMMVDKEGGASFGVYDSDNLTAGVIVNKINGDSTVQISADRVYIGNETSTTVINGKLNISDLTADLIQAKIATLAVLEATSMHSVGNIGAEGSLMASNIYLASPGEQSTSDSLLYAIKDLQISLNSSTNIYTLQKKDYRSSSWVDVGNFSRAVSSWGVAWSNGTLTLTANPQNQTKEIMVYQGTWSRNGDVFSGNILYSEDGGEHGFSTGKQYSVDASSYIQSVKDATGLVIDTENNEIRREYSAATKAISITADSSISYNSSTHKYTATGTAKAGNTTMDTDTAVSGTEAYLAGVADGEGEFTSVSVTPINASTATMLGAAASYYAGDGGSFTVQGSAYDYKIKMYGMATFYYKGSDGDYYQVGGNRRWFWQNASEGIQLYRAGTVTKYDGGTYYYQAGSAGTYYTRST